MIGITLSACYFAYIHWSGHAVFEHENLTAWAEERESSVKRYHQVAAVCFTFVLGLLCGVAVVYFQNIWVAIAIHAIWNYVVTRAWVVVVVYWMQYTRNARISIRWKELWKP
jgi:membrane protease YdiL (CAAX protease family)